MVQTKLTLIARKVLRSKLSSDLLYVFIAQVLTMGLAFTVNKIVGVSAGVEGYAIFNLIRRAGGLLACFIAGGLTIALPRYLAKCSLSTDRKLQQAFISSSYIIIAFYAIISGLLLIFFPEKIGKLFFQESFQASFLALTFLFAIGQTASNIALSYYQGTGDFKKYNQLHIQFVCGLLACAIIFHHNFIYILISSYIFSLIYGIVILWRKISWKSFLAPAKNHIRATWKMLFSYGISRMISDIVLFLENIIPLIIIVDRFGINDAGLYSAGLSINLIIFPLFSFSSNIFLQRFSASSRARKTSHIRRSLFFILIIYTITSTMGALFIINFKENLINLLFSKEFIDAAPLINFFALAIIPRAIFQLYKSPLEAVSRKPYNLINITIRIGAFYLILLGAESAIDCAKGYFYVGILSALLSIFSWEYVTRKR